jgi:DNA-binding CsgD family transcriptional regulator
MLENEYLSILDVKTLDELRSQLVSFSEQLGFQTVAGLMVIDSFTGPPAFISVDNTPAAYRSIYEDRNTGRSDPVMQHCKFSNLPIIWDQSTYLTSNQMDRWEQQACFGYRCGISLPMHMPHGRHFVLGAVRDHALPSDPAEATRAVSSLHLLSVYAQEAAANVLSLDPAFVEKPLLTARELEALRWTMDGKTAWELGCILGIAEQTAARHVHNASRKLGCVNKHQAVLKALRLGLIRAM